MLKATGVKMECMKEDNDMEKKQGFLQKRQTTDSPQSSLEKMGTNVSQLQCPIFYQTHLMSEKLKSTVK